jgi:hypothetical protein
MFSFGSSAVWVGMVLTVLLIWAVYLALRTRQVLREASEVHAARRAQNDPIATASLDVFRRAYWRARGPRAVLSAFLATLLALALTPLIAEGLSSLWRLVWNLSDRPQDLEEGLFLWQVFIALGVALVWAGIVGLTLRYHHRKPTLSLEQELRKETAL